MCSWRSRVGPDGESEVATLTLPTGLGKTFTGLSAAFELRDSLADRETAESARQIIYALPYTSIIEQTRELFEDPELWGADPEKSALTVHHYLSETVVHHDDYDAGDTAAKQTMRRQPRCSVKHGEMGRSSRRSCSYSKVSLGRRTDRA